METKLPVRKEREKVEVPRFYKKYRSPFQRSLDYFININIIK